MSRLKQS